MSVAYRDREDEGVDRLLSGARKIISSVRNCWLVTEAETGGANARPMGMLAEVDESRWTFRFIADDRSRKATDIRRVSRVELIFQHDAQDAFVALIGKATVLEDASEIRRLWDKVYKIQREVDRANATFIEVDAERMCLWIRGVTPEPFGLRPTEIERDSSGAWRLHSASCDAG
jgi:general stress protein 26